MYRKESKDISGLYMEGFFGQTPPVPETQVFFGEVLTGSKFCT